MIYFQLFHKCLPSFKLTFYVSARPDLQAKALCSQVVRPSVRPFVRLSFRSSVTKLVNTI